MFHSGRTDKKTLNFLYDDATKYYSVITNVAGCFAQRYICQGCNKGNKRGKFHNCDATCSDCLAVPPCEYGQVRRPCNDCNRCFRSDTCFENHRTRVISGKTICERKRICNICKALICNNHEYFKTYCCNCQKHCVSGHKCYMAVLSKSLPSSAKVLCFLR